VNVLTAAYRSYGSTPTNEASNVGFRVASAALPGDANLDGTVDINDLTTVLANYNQTGMTWADGDFIGTGTVDINDLGIVLANYNTTLGTGLAAVPEPSCVALLGVGTVSLLAFALRRRA
jgi:hypothetical protein